MKTSAGIGGPASACMRCGVRKTHAEHPLAGKPEGWWCAYCVRQVASLGEYLGSLQKRPVAAPSAPTAPKAAPPTGGISEPDEDWMLGLTRLSRRELRRVLNTLVRHGRLEHHGNGSKARPRSWGLVGGDEESC